MSKLHIRDKYTLIETVMLKEFNCHRLFSFETVVYFTLPLFPLISGQTAELTTMKARTNVTEKTVEALKRDGEGKTQN